jgi:ferritin-like metal-binding protein YciE
VDASVSLQEFRRNPSQESQLIANPQKQTYVDGLRLLYSAERQLKSTLPQMARAASAKGLRAWLRRRLEQAKEHVAILEQLCTAILESPRGEKCTQTEHFLAEGVQMMGKRLAPERRDRELIAMAKSIEDQQIAGLGWVDAHARPFKDERASTGLKKMIEEERARDKELAQLWEAIEVETAGLGQMDGAEGAWREAGSRNAEALER